MQCEVIVSRSFPVTTHFYDDGLRAFILVDSMQPFRLPLMNRKYVCIPALDFGDVV